jgi:soluble lytic murein transglycosylase-like protein
MADAVRSLLFIFWAVLLVERAFAQQGEPLALPERMSEQAPCVAPAADYHSVNPWVLKAILKVESGFNPRAFNRNANGTVDVGMAQINSIHFSKLRNWGVAPSDLLDGCVATYVAAWHLAGRIREHGNTWFGIAAYHSTSACQNRRYAGLVWNELLKWGVVRGEREKVVSLRACGYIAPGSTEVPTSHKNRTARSGSSVAFDSE